MSIVTSPATPSSDPRLGAGRDVGDGAAIEERTREIGRDLFRRIGRGPRPWQRGWWDDRLMDNTLSDPQVRVQLFRFIDALPALRAPASVRTHLEEYLAEAGDRVPAWLRLAVRLAPPGTEREAMLAWSARTAAGVMARKFIAGSTPEQAAQTVMALRRKSVAFTADLLGEAVISEAEADVYQRTCIEILEGLSGPLAAAPEVPLIDRDDRGPIPRVNLSLKLSSLTTHFDPIHAEATIDAVAARLRPILRTARKLGAYVHVDMEQYSYRALSYDLFRRVFGEPEFRDWPDVGIVVQAYQPDAESELEMLRDFARSRGAPITIRLVKGAYWDYEVLMARQLGWPEPVYLRKWETDACYERCSRFLIDHHETLRPAFAGHNVRSLSYAMALAEARGLPKGAIELQTLYGMGDAIQDALVARGQRVRVYTPYGAMLPGMAYLVRRLLENTSNESFLKASSARDVPVETLLRNPEEIGSMSLLSRKAAPPAAAPPAGELPPFRNAPTADFAKAENRRAMVEALAQVRGRFGKDYPLLIDGREVMTESRIDSLDPAQQTRVVGRSASADAGHAEAAIAAAKKALKAWSARSPRERADVLLKAAALIRERRFELIAWMVYECGKPWREADGELVEASDFCELYARDMIRIAEPRRRDVPGETNACTPIPRGVVSVIAPWNFPLAISCTMVAGALVAGNTVVYKPSEQSPVVGWHLVKILHEAGVPAGALNYLPGVGEAVGPTLVKHPDVNMVAFTGSRDVGLLVNRLAAETPPGQDHVKRVIAEMGGKNALIIDDDADLDEAVVGVVNAAFGYSGQKCSACSRAIVLDGVYDAFLARLVEAARSVKVGPAEDPETLVGPVIDADSRRKILSYKEVARREGRVVLDTDVAEKAVVGTYVGPMIVADVPPDARVAQEEIFGPLLSVIRARDLDHALEIANGTPYALTGGIYSRSPVNIERARREFLVGNLYINRGNTGAMVDRQPFGGFKLSGIGTKAGGSEYLYEFLIMRSITENTMRRGFAPEDPAAPEPAAAASGRL
ncbi:1-pyrroline-5-carboxylate dehydrogenase 1 [Aquisphaera giovannonii]|uniref:L-glutamate gamma-semialdehyde dehydrogenase n=1 Tax=Aquisphaera giovannonii TaxID=406548 RepID=A0A5B9W866_9BACT|nr:L-glutamate gamma-semialdehyde dehydrogenase [Aquisphaera giovannonii]QEH36110.1 1-pyrroline-5-carboxylate dehydrogenase 1 [Aquisphaera giovannonii]